MLDDSHAVHTCEGCLRRVGKAVLTVPAPCQVQFSSMSWYMKSAWGPADNPDYALDPDGEWYDKVVEGPVMQEDPQSGLGIQPKHKKSKVSVCIYG
jgi:hypothetical protein